MEITHFSAWIDNVLKISIRTLIGGLTISLLQSCGVLGYHVMADSEGAENDSPWNFFEEEEIDGSIIHKKPCSIRVRRGAINNAEQTLSTGSIGQITIGFIKEFDDDEEKILVPSDKYEMLCDAASTALMQIKHLLAISDIHVPVTIYLVSESHFFKEMEAPIWAEALSVDGIIYLPHQYLAAENINKTIHHEILHAIVYHIAGNRVPAWLEEGLAQILSGQVDPNAAIPNYHDKKAAIRSLRGGSSYKDKEDADIAYGISVFAVSMLAKEHGFATFGTYLSKLALGYSHARAFQTAFKETEDDLERRISKNNRKQKLLEKKPR